MDYKALAANVENREGFGTQEWVYRVLRAGIVNGALPGGMQLKQDEISAALNVTGQFVLTPEAKQPFEIKAKSVVIEADSAADYPLQKKRQARRRIQRNSGSCPMA